MRSPVTTLAGLLRIAAWTLLFLWALGVVLPPGSLAPSDVPFQDRVRGDRVVPMALAASDPRAFRDFASRNGAPFRIAWLGSSSIRISHLRTRDGGPGTAETFLPVEVANRLDRIDERDVEVGMYFMIGARLFDEYLSLLHALEQSPDFVVVTLNPFWLFNNYAISGRSNLYGDAAPRASTRPDSWGTLLALASPAQILWGVVSPILPALRDRWTYNQILTTVLGGLRLFSVSPDQGPTDGVQPIRFWVHFRLMNGAGPAGRIEWQKSILALSDPDEETGSKRVLRMMLSALRESGVPALVYLSPVAPEILADPVTAEKLARVEETLGDVAAEFENNSLRVLNVNPSRHLEPMPFRDLVHLTEAGPLTRYLAGQIRASEGEIQ